MRSQRKPGYVCVVVEDTWRRSVTRAGVFDLEELDRVVVAAGDGGAQEAAADVACGCRRGVRTVGQRATCRPDGDPATVSVGASPPANPGDVRRDQVRVKTGPAALLRAGSNS